MAKGPPKHVVRLLLLLGGFLVVAFAAKAYLTDPSYYRYGYYRADAVPELAEGEAHYLGSDYCYVECHEERAQDWPLSAHKTVQCEACHGPAPMHPDDGISLAPADTIRLCSTCHQEMPARPEAQPQIVLGEHPFDDGQIMPCTECHDPHAPGPVLRAEEEAEGKLSVATADATLLMPESAKKCAKCHGKLGEGVKQNPALAGLAAPDFVERMKAYRAGAGDSKIMTRFAESLSDEEITELAAYYEGLGESRQR